MYSSYFAMMTLEMRSCSAVSTCARRRVAKNDDGLEGRARSKSAGSRGAGRVETLIETRSATRGRG